MTKEEMNLYECEDVIQLQNLDTLVKKNTVKFQEYINQHELLRVRFFLTSDVCKFLKTWIHIVYEDITSLKSQYSELGRLYEILLGNNFIKEFLDYSNSQEILQLKFVETVIDNKRLKTNVDAVNKEVTSLKSEYEKLNQIYEELSKNNFAKEFLNFVKPKETVKLKIVEKLDECQNLEISLDKACTKILTLNSELDKSIRRYQMLSDNNNVQEFLRQAKYQDELRLKSTENLKERVASLELQLNKSREIINIERRDRRQIEKERGSSKSCLDQSKRKTATLESQLKKVRELLNKERCRCKKISEERDSSARLSEELCRLLAKHLDCKLHKKTKEVNISGDLAAPGSSNVNVVSKSSSSSKTIVSKSKNNIEEVSISNNNDNNITQDHQIPCIEMDCIEPIVAFVVKKEKTNDESLISRNSSVNKAVELSNPHINDKNSPFEGTVLIGLSTESNLKCGTSSLQCHTSNGQQLRNNIKKSHSFSNSPRRILPKLLPKKPTPEVKQKLPSDNIEEVSFGCDKCKKSFVVKPNERKPQNCPFCEMKCRANGSFSVLPVGTSKVLEPESEPLALLDNSAEARKISKSNHDRGRRRFSLRIRRSNPALRHTARKHPN